MYEGVASTDLLKEAAAAAGHELGLRFSGMCFDGYVSSGHEPIVLCRHGQKSTPFFAPLEEANRTTLRYVHMVKRNGGGVFDIRLFVGVCSGGVLHYCEYQRRDKT